MSLVRLLKMFLGGADRGSSPTVKEGLRLDESDETQ